jgi:hypothetical protein
MKYLVIGVLACAAIGAVFLGGVCVFAEPKGETITVKGEIVDLWCFLDHGGRGPDHKDCAVACAKAGNPVGIATDKDEVYLLMGGEKHQPGRDVVIEKMAQTVTVTGTLVKKGGLQAIYIKELK